MINTGGPLPISILHGRGKQSVKTWKLNINPRPPNGPGASQERLNAALPGTLASRLCVSLQKMEPRRKGGDTVYTQQTSSESAARIDEATQRKPEERAEKTAAHAKPFVSLALLLQLIFSCFNLSGVKRFGSFETRVVRLLFNLYF